MEIVILNNVTTNPIGDCHIAMTLDFYSPFSLSLDFTRLCRTGNYRVALAMTGNDRTEHIVAIVKKPPLDKVDSLKL